MVDKKKSKVIVPSCLYWTSPSKWPRLTSSAMTSGLGVALSNSCFASDYLCAAASFEKPIISLSSARLYFLFAAASSSASNPNYSCTLSESFENSIACVTLRCISFVVNMSA
jgi:hypothetical protein